MYISNLRKVIIKKCKKLIDIKLMNIFLFFSYFLNNVKSLIKLMQKDKTFYLFDKNIKNYY